MSMIETQNPGQVATTPQPDPTKEAIVRATAHYDHTRRQLEQQAAELTRLMLTIESRNQQIVQMERQHAQQLQQLELQLAEAYNRADAYRAECDDAKQERADLLALFSSLRAQLDKFEVPLPRKRRDRVMQRGNGLDETQPQT